MPRRHGWLRDYHQSYDMYGDEVDEQPQQPNNPAQGVNVTVNINLGDILSQIASGKKTAKEALEEMTTSKSKTQLNECDISELVNKAYELATGRARKAYESYIESIKEHYGDSVADQVVSEVKRIKNEILGR